MASCNMASAASGFVLSPNNVSGNTNTNLLVSRMNMVMYPTTRNTNSRLVVRASEEAAATPTVEGEAAPKTKPPPIGPKRGAKVCYILCHLYTLLNKLCRMKIYFHLYFLRNMELGKLFA